MAEHVIQRIYTDDEGRVWLVDGHSDRLLGYTLDAYRRQQGIALRIEENLRRHIARQDAVINTLRDALAARDILPAEGIEQQGEGDLS